MYAEHNEKNGQLWVVASPWSIVGRLVGAGQRTWTTELNRLMMFLVSTKCVIVFGLRHALDLAYGAQYFSV